MKSCRFYVDRMMHFLASHSRHGTHSPFVYRLVDEVVYPKRRMDEPRDKIERLMVRLIDQYRPHQVHQLGSGQSADPADFVIAKGRDAETAANQLGVLWPKLHPASVLVMSDIYGTAGMKRLWQSIKAKPEVTATIDLFHIGLVFFHSGQAKEHFRIKY